jgi:hypothetical protein
MTNETTPPSYATLWSTSPRTRALALAAAAIAGGLLGGLVFKRAGRLAFAAAVAFVARDVWFGEGRSGLERFLRNQRTPS